MLSPEKNIRRGEGTCDLTNPVGLKIGGETKLVYMMYEYYGVFTLSILLKLWLTKRTSKL